MSTVLYLHHLPDNSESSFVFTLFGRDDNFRDQIKEIYTYDGGSSFAWVVFLTPNAAAQAATYYDNQHFGPLGQKVYTSLSTEAAIPENATNRLTKFNRDLENQIESCTVEITDLPAMHTIRNLNQMFEPTIEEFANYFPTGDPYYDSEPIEILHMKSPEYGVGLVRVRAPWMANSVVRQWAGEYWKCRTLNARCVPDEEMDDLIVSSAGTGEKDTMLFVTGIKPGTSSTEVRDIFKGFNLRDVNMPPGGKAFCFIFLRQEDANTVLAQYGQGVKHQGRTIRVSISQKGKKKAGNAVAARPAPAKTTNLKINNMPYGSADSNIRAIFQGYNLTRVVVKQGYAFVDIAADEAERAVQELTGKKVGGRYITVKVSERRKT
jgi:hypothetical protein